MNSPEEETDRLAGDAIAAHGADIYRYALRRVRTQQDADDVAASVFMVVWEKRDRLPRVEPDLRMWCFGIARNKVREHLRATQRTSYSEDVSLLQSADAAHDTEAQAVKHDEARAVRDSLSRLDQLSRELVMLIHWEKLSVADASRALGLTVSTGRTRYARAREKLALLLTPTSPSHGSPYAARPDVRPASPR